MNFSSSLLAFLAIFSVVRTWPTDKTPISDKYKKTCIICERQNTSTLERNTEDSVTKDLIGSSTTEEPEMTSFKLVLEEEITEMNPKN